MGRWLDILRLRVRSLFARDSVERELDKELRFHIEQETEVNMQAGMAPGEARLAAIRRLGGMAVIQEECRDTRRTAYVENFLRDLRYAARTLARVPGFTVVIVATLALSIGANSAIFGVVDGVLWRPLPYREADRIVRIFFSNRTYPKFPVNPLDLRDIRARNRSFAAIAGITRFDRQLSGVGQPERLAAFSITAGYFRVLGVSPRFGREFTTDDELPARGNQVILSDRIWRTRFSADPRVVGRTIMLDAESFTVAGVMPPMAHPGNEYHAMADGDTVDVWTPFTYRPQDTGRGSHYIEVFARLKPGVTLEQARGDMKRQVAQLAREHPDNATGWEPLVLSLYQELVSPARRLLLVLLGAVGLVLLIACANAANLLLARATARRREIAIRAALGAGGGRLARQMLAESLLISLLGAGVGALVAVGGVRALVALVPADFPRAADIRVNGLVFAFTLLVALVTGLVAGLAPALHSARPDLQQALRDGGRGSSAGAHQLKMRDAMVVVEVSLACVLLIGAGLLLRSLVNMLRADPGFHAEYAVTAVVSPPQAKYRKPKDVLAFYGRLGRELSAAPGVRVAALASDLPWTGYDENISGFTIEGRPQPPGQDFHARFHSTSEGYFQALGIPLIRGRFFTPQDDMTGIPVIIINRVMARSYWGADDVVGRRLTFEDHPKPEDWFTVVGVVGDVKDRPNSAAAEPAIWWPIQQTPFGFTDAAIVVRGESDPAELAAAVRGAVRSVDPDLAAANVKQMDEVAAKSFSAPKFALFLVGLFAALAAALAAIGIYGVISYSVNQRSNEFGLRMALGARPADVVRQVMVQGTRLAAFGIVLGLAGALGLGRALRSLLYGVRTWDPPTFAAVAIAATAVTALACYVPARRATTADPLVTLRSE